MSQQAAEKLSPEGGGGFKGCGKTRLGHKNSRVCIRARLVGQGFIPDCRKRLKTHEGFTGCGKTRSGGRRGFQPPHKANRINIGFSRGGTLFAYFARKFEFFRSLFRWDETAGLAES